MSELRPDLDAGLRILTERFGKFLVKAGVPRNELSTVQWEVLAAIVADLHDEDIDVLDSVFHRAREAAVSEYIDKVARHLDATDND